MGVFHLLYEQAETEPVEAVAGADTASAFDRLRASKCVACGESMGEEVAFQPNTGLYVLEIEKEKYGIKVSHVKPIYDSVGERL